MILYIIIQLYNFVIIWSLKIELQLYYLGVGLLSKTIIKFVIFQKKFRLAKEKSN